MKQTYEQGVVKGYNQRVAEAMLERCCTCNDYIDSLKECSMGFLNFLALGDLETFNGRNFGCCFWKHKKKWGIKK